MVEIASKVMGKAVTRMDTVWNEGGRHIFFEAKTMNEGEEKFEEVGEG